MPRKGRAAKPINWVERWRKRYGPLAVECLISQRWLQFPENSFEGPHGKKYMWVDIMTEPTEKERRLTSICISKEELLAALEKID